MDYNYYIHSHSEQKWNFIERILNLFTVDFVDGIHEFTVVN